MVDFPDNNRKNEDTHCKFSNFIMETPSIAIHIKSLTSSKIVFFGKILYKTF